MKDGLSTEEDLTIYLIVETIYHDKVIYLSCQPASWNNSAAAACLGYSQQTAAPISA